MLLREPRPDRSQHPSPPVTRPRAGFRWPRLSGLSPVLETSAEFVPARGKPQPLSRFVRAEGKTSARGAHHELRVALQGYIAVQADPSSTSRPRSEKHPPSNCVSVSLV